MGVQCVMAVHKLFIDFKEVNDSDEEYATTVSLGVLYLHMELVYINNTAHRRICFRLRVAGKMMSNRHSEGPRKPLGLN
jgi:hypothetical protein